MSKYHVIMLSDLLSNPYFKGVNLEVTGVARGVEKRGTIFNLRTGYTAFLECGDSLLLIQGDCDRGIGSLDEISMLKTSSETGRQVSVRGKIVTHPPYKMKVDGVKLQNYESILYKYG